MIRKFHLKNQIVVYIIHNVECKSQIKYQGLYIDQKVYYNNLKFHRPRISGLFRAATFVASKLCGKLHIPSELKKKKSYDHFYKQCKPDIIITLEHDKNDLFSIKLGYMRYICSPISI